jgi:hypothetical protein
MGEHDFQTSSLHFNYNSVLPHELRLWTRGTKERWTRHEIEALKAYLESVLAHMPMPHTKEE